jgi:ABC-2 type transport system ATP-binding protein
MIEVYELTKRYGRTKAVDDLTFEVHPGRVTGFLGPNGAGKSTTMRAILGLDAPDSGETFVNDRPYRTLTRPLHQVGALLDANQVHGGRTARGHLLALAASNGIPSRRVGEVLGIVGLESAAGKRVKGFSLGMKQRLGIAGALLGDPEVLMFDEPVNGLDPEGIRWIRTLMKAYAAEGRTVFVSSHLMAEMALTADHLVVIGKGQLIADTGVTEFIDRSSAGHVLVRSPESERLAGLLRGRNAAVAPHGTDGLAVTGLTTAEVGGVAAAHGIELHELAVQRSSLEEAFMELTSGSVEFEAAAVPVRGRKDG